MNTYRNSVLRGGREGGRNCKSLNHARRNGRHKLKISWLKLISNLCDKIFLNKSYVIVFAKSAAAENIAFAYFPLCSTPQAIFLDFYLLLQCHISQNHQFCCDHESG